MSPNVRKGKHYTGLNYSYLDKTFDVSAISLHKTLQTAMELDAINEWQRRRSELHRRPAHVPGLR